MKKILITGVAGFIGSCVAKRFIDEGFQVAGVDDISSGKKIFRRDLTLSKVIYR